MDIVQHTQARDTGAISDVSFSAQPGDAPPAIDSGIFKRLRRRKLVFTVTFGTISVAVATAFLALTPVYKADALVAISAPDQVLAGQGNNAAQLTIGDNADLESQAAILASPMTIRDMLVRPGIRDALIRDCEARRVPSWRQQAKDLLHLSPGSNCASEIDDMTKIVGILQERLNVGTSGRSRVITASYVSPLADVAQTIASGIVQAYIDATTRDRLEPRNQAIAWIQSELDRVSTRLQSTEAQIQTFLQGRGVVNGQKGPIASEQLTNLSGLLAQAESDRAVVAGRLQQALLGSLTGSSLDTRAISDIKQQLALVTGQLAQMSPRYGPATPQVIETQQQRQALQRTLSQETGALSRSATTDFQVANQRVISLLQQVERLKSEVRGNDDASTAVASMQRSVATDHDLYLDLTRSLNKLQTERRLITTNAHLVSLAELPQRVFFPKLSTFLLAGVLLATTGGTLAALLRDRLDPTLRTSGSLAGGLRVLACVPNVMRLGRRSTKVGHRIENPSEFQEAIRSLYAECLLLDTPLRGPPLRTLMFTSAQGGEGKSTLVQALGYFAASAGRHVLILELDLRRPSMANSLSLPRKIGVADVLRGAPFEDAICHSRPGLDVMAAGSPTMDSTELLGGKRLRLLLNWAVLHYDLVLVDAPASRVLPDARILACNVDGIIYCARWGHSHTDAVANGISEIRLDGGRVIGMVLNQVESAYFSLYEKSMVRAGSYRAVSRV